MNINQNEENNRESQLTILMHVVYKVCTKLNSLLPISQQMQISQSVQSLIQTINKITQLIILSMQSYEKHLQTLQDNLRKHIKNEIQLKIYYQHLQQIVSGLKKQKSSDHDTIKSLKTQIQSLKEKQKNYMTLSNNNTRNNDENGVIDAIAKIKNRLSLSNTGQFYASYATKKIDKEQQTLDLRDKRQSLSNALKQLYQSPIQRPERKNSKKQKNNKNKSKDKSKQKFTQNLENKHVLSKSKSGKTVQTNSHHSLKKPIKQKPCELKEQKIQKNYLKMTGSGASSRRNSKI